MTESAEPPRTVHVEILARVGTDTYEIGYADLTELGHGPELATLLRKLADEVEGT